MIYGNQVDLSLLVSQVGVTIADKPVGHGLHQVLADAVVRVVDAVGVAAEPLPREPPHGRSASQAVVQAGRRTQQQQQQIAVHGVGGWLSASDDFRADRELYRAGTRRG